MSSFIGLTGSRKEKGKRWRCVYRGHQRAVVHACFEGEILTGQLACLITFVSRCRAEPVTLLIKASLSRVSGSVSLSADCSPHSAARSLLILLKEVTGNILFDCVREREK